MYRQSGWDRWRRKKCWEERIRDPFFHLSPTMCLSVYRATMHDDTWATFSHKTEFPQKLLCIWKNKYCYRYNKYFETLDCWYCIKRFQGNDKILESDDSIKYIAENSSSYVSFQGCMIGYFMQKQNNILYKLGVSSKLTIVSYIQFYFHIWNFPFMSMIRLQYICEDCCTMSCRQSGKGSGWRRRWQKLRQIEKTISKMDPFSFSFSQLLLFLLHTQTRKKDGG